MKRQIRKITKEQAAGYQRLVERIVSAARHRQAQMGRGYPSGEYIRALGEALCDENLTFVEPSPGRFVVEGTVGVVLGGDIDELRAFLASSGLAAGVWLDFDRDVLGVERVWAIGVTEEGLTPFLFPEASVLVAVMNRRHDFEIARDEGWYRIPVRSAPKFFPPDYLAFYFTKAFKEQAFGVHYFAAVRGHELVTRRDLLPSEPDHPRADQRYYKLQLGRLARREPPIVSKTWRRITFVLTNGRRFANASEINELVLGPKEHDILWRALKERGLHAERNYVIRDERSVYKVDLAVMCRDGAVGILCGDEPAPKRDRQPQFPLLQFTPEQVETSVDQCLVAVREAVDQLGGAKLVEESECNPIRSTEVVTVRFSKETEEVILPESLGYALGLSEGDRVEVHRQGSVLWVLPKDIARSPGPLTDLAMIISSSQPVGSVNVESLMNKRGYEQLYGSFDL